VPATRFQTLDSLALAANRVWSRFVAATIDYYMARRLRTKHQQLLRVGHLDQLERVGADWYLLAGPLRVPKAATVDVATVRLRFGSDRDTLVQVTSRALPFYARATGSNVAAVAANVVPTTIGPLDLRLTRGASTEDISVWVRQVEPSTPVLTGDDTTWGFFQGFLQNAGAGMTDHQYKNYTIRLFDEAGNLAREADIIDNNDTTLFYDRNPPGDKASGTYFRTQDFVRTQYTEFELFAGSQVSLRGLDVLGRRN